MTSSASLILVFTGFISLEIISASQDYFVKVPIYGFPIDDPKNKYYSEIETNGTKDLWEAFSAAKEGLVTSVEFHIVGPIPSVPGAKMATYKVTVSDARYTPYWLRYLYSRAIKDGYQTFRATGQLEPEFQGVVHTPYNPYGGTPKSKFVTTLHSGRYSTNFWYALDFCRSIGGRVFSEDDIDVDHRYFQKLPLNAFSSTWVSNWKYDYLSDAGRNETVCHNYSTRRNTNGSAPCTDSGLNIVCEKYEKECFPEIARECGELEKCRVTRHKFACDCIDGYKRTIEGENCRDIDECQTGANFCHKLAKCSNTVGSYNCSCIPPYIGDGLKCENFIKLRQHFVVRRNETTNKTATEVLGRSLASKCVSYFNRTNPIRAFENISILDVNVDDVISDGDNGCYAMWTAVIEDELTVEELVKHYQVQSPGTSLVIFEKPKPVDGACLQTQISHRGVRYLMEETEVGAFSYSLQKCPSGRAKALVGCVNRGNVTQFNLGSLQVHECEEPDPGAKRVENVVQNLKNITKTGDFDIDFVADVISNLANETSNNQTKVTGEAIKCVVTIADKVAKKIKKMIATKKDEKEPTEKAYEVMTALQTLSEFVIVQPNETVVQQTETIKLQISKPASGETVTFESEFDEGNTTGQNKTDSGKRGISASLSPPSFDLDARNSYNNNAIFISFDGAVAHPKNDSRYALDLILSVKVAKREISDIENLLQFRMALPPSNKKVARFFRCGYLQTVIRKWAFEGCHTVPGAYPPLCKCDHLTDFSTLIQTMEVKPNIPLHLFGTVGCSLSIISLLATIIIFFSSEKLRKKMPTKLHLHFAVTLLLVYVTFLFGVDRKRPYVPCVIVAALTHFGLLASWGWMAVECYSMYKKFVTVLYHPHKRYVLNSCIIVYGLSAAVTGVTVGVSVGFFDRKAHEGWEPDISNDPAYFLPSKYINDTLCWLHGPALYYGFLLPIAIVFVVNTYASIYILRSITCRQTRIRSTSPANDILTCLTRIFTVSLLLGMSWVFAVFLAVSDDVYVQTIFGWLFGITNNLKGLFIFLLFCVRYEEVRNEWWPDLRSFILCRKKEECVAVNNASYRRSMQTFNKTISVSSKSRGKLSTTSF